MKIVADFAKEINISIKIVKIDGSRWNRKYIY